MYQMCVTERENSTITSKFGSKKVGVGILEMERDVGCLDRRLQDTCPIAPSLTSLTGIEESKAIQNSEVDN